nr:hypothetical protein CFP56_32184 [Quercus suber]
MEDMGTVRESSAGTSWCNWSDRYLMNFGAHRPYCRLVFILQGDPAIVPPLQEYYVLSLPYIPFSPSSSFSTHSLSRKSRRRSTRPWRRKDTG